MRLVDVLAQLKGEKRYALDLGDTRDVTENSLVSPLHLAYRVRLRPLQGNKLVAEHGEVAGDYKSIIVQR